MIVLRLVAFCCLTIIAAVLIYVSAYGHSLEEPLHDWFMAQLIPRGPEQGKSCCSMADQVYAEEDIRNSRYWVRFRPREWANRSTDWMMVPDEALLLGPNKAQVPVVWYGFDSGKVFIRCFAPGSGA